MNSNITPIINSRFVNQVLPNSDPLIIEMSGQGPQGMRGESGNGIESVEKTSTSGLIDTYTMYFTNGDTFEYFIVNGQNAEGFSETDISVKDNTLIMPNKVLTKE